MTVFNPIYFVPTNQNLASLTFDDGPTFGVTDKILQFLNERNIKATFFMVGEQVLKNQALAKDVAASGHDIAIHSQKHKRGMKTWEYSAVRDDFKMAKDSIASVTGKAPTMIRAPFGNICQTIADACIDLDLDYVGWSVTTKDWMGKDPEKNWRLNFLTSGSIALFHDGGRITKENVSKSIKLLDYIAQKAQQQKIQLISVSQLVLNWDDNLIVEDGDRRTIGCHSVTIDGKSLTVTYWHPNDIIQGISYGYESRGLKYSVDIPPMSNVDEWIAPVETPASYHGVGKLFSLWMHSKVKGIKLNLGCGNSILDGWENFDIDERAVNGVRPWAWDRNIPYPDGSVETVLIQHSLQHCRPEDYDKNFSEIKRVLMPGGTIVVKEADNRYYVWSKPGERDKDGIIASTTSEPEMVEVLSRNGFQNVITDPQIVVNKYGDAINRQRRLLSRKQLFVVEGTKPKGE